MAEQTTTETSTALQTWLNLQEALRTLPEEDCWKLLAEEQAGKRRPQYLMRIFSRANKLRTDRERAELLAPRH